MNTETKELLTRHGFTSTDHHEDDQLSPGQVLITDPTGGAILVDDDQVIVDYIKSKVKTTNTLTITIYTQTILTKIEKIVERVNKKLEGYDLSVELNTTERFEPHVNGVTSARVWDVTVIAPNATASGWELVAILKPAPEVGCYTVKTSSTTEIPATHWELDALYCGHCRKIRRRNFSLLLHHADTGRWEQVGSTCVNEFLGGAGDQILKTINAIGRIVKETREPQPQLAERCYPPEVVLQVTIQQLIDTRGHFVPSRSDNGETPTWKIAKGLLDQWADGKNLHITPKAEIAAERCGAWFDSWINDDHRESEYIRNVETAWDNPVSVTGLPYLCSLPILWKRILSPQASTSNGRPAIGSEVEFSGEVVFAKASRTRTGRDCQWLVVRTDQGRTLTTESYDIWEAGDSIRGYGTVRSYRNYRGEAQLKLELTASYRD
jgi:hypothetical protein